MPDTAINVQGPMVCAQVSQIMEAIHIVMVPTIVGLNMVSDYFVAELFHIF